MDAGSILGSLLGRKSGKSGSTNILRDILSGGRRQEPSATPRAEPAPRRPSVVEDDNGLQDMLRDAYSKYQRRTGAPPLEGLEQRRSAPAPAPAPAPRSTRPVPSSTHSRGSELDNDETVVLIRAMINAAKSDGQLDRTEQESIVKELGDVSNAELEFLKTEFAKPLDVREFAWSVPLGMEQQIYAVSLMAIELDQNTEATYLRDLAHGLRLDPNLCNQLHRKFNAPEIFR